MGVAAGYLAAHELAVVDQSVQGAGGRPRRAVGHFIRRDQRAEREAPSRLPFTSFTFG